MRGHLLRSPVLSLAEVGSKLWVRRYRNKEPLWEPAVVLGQEGRNIINVKTENGDAKRCHSEQMKPYIERNSTASDLTDTDKGNSNEDAVMAEVEDALPKDGMSPPLANTRAKRQVKQPDRLTYN